MIDCMNWCGDLQAETQLTIRRDNIFFADGGLMACGVIENMAQSCAARMGYVETQGNAPIKIGFIGDIKQCVISQLPREHDVVITTVRVISQVFNLTMVALEAKVGEQTIATAQMKIATIQPS